MKFNLVCIYAIILNKQQHVEFSGSNYGCNACSRKRFLLEKHWYISMWSRLNWFERFHNLQVTVNQIQVEFCVRHHSRTRSDWTNWGYLIDHQVRRVKWVWPNPSIYTPQPGYPTLMTFWVESSSVLIPRFISFWLFFSYLVGNCFSDCSCFAFVPGDHPEEVKARLKFWAQAVACTVKLCS